jgi:HEAT repeat protein
MPSEIDSRLREAVRDSLELLRAGEFEDAFFGVIHLPPAIVELLISAYHAETSRDVRSGLLRIIWEFRTPLAVPLLEEALRDRRDNRWKDALDGLVTQASLEAIGALERVLADEATKPQVLERRTNPLYAG